MTNTLLRMLLTNQQDFPPEDTCPRHRVVKNNSYAGDQMVKRVLLRAGRSPKRYNGSAQVTIGTF